MNEIKTWQDLNELEKDLSLLAQVMEFSEEVRCTMQQGATKLIELRAALAEREWRTIDTAPSLKAVLVHYPNALGNSRIVKAKFIPRYTVESSGDEEGVDEYHEDSDKFTYIEGWWELIDNWDEYNFVFIDENKPTHWMPLPAVPINAMREGCE